MDHHGPGLIRLYPVAHHGPDPPPELQKRVWEGTIVTVPLREVELQDKPFLHDFLKKCRLFILRFEQISLTNIELLLVEPEGPYVEIGQLFFLRDGDGDASVGFFQFAVCRPVLDTHHLRKKVAIYQLFLRNLN